MKTITLEDGTKVQVSDEQYEALVPKANWRAVRGGEYWLVGEGGHIFAIVDSRSNGDNFRHDTGNYFRSESEAEAYRTYLLAKGKIERAVRQRNGNWKPDWSDGDQEKYYIAFNNQLDWYYIDYTFSAEGVHEYYCATRAIAQSIIDDFTPELDIIRKWVNR